MDFLPFTRPSIDEATIAGVAEVLRSGWITTGAQAQAFEARLSEYFGGRPACAMASGTGTLEVALAVAGDEARRRPHRDRQSRPDRIETFAKAELQP